MSHSHQGIIVGFGLGKFDGFFVFLSDPVKKHATLQKLACLYKEIGEQTEVGWSWLR